VTFGVCPDDKPLLAAEHAPMNKMLKLSLSLSASLCLIPALASASTRYATPDGTGPPMTCPQANPCSFEDVMDYTWLHDGDEVVIGPGSYEDAPEVGTDKAVWIHGEAGKPRPLVDFEGNGFFIDDAGAKISDLRIETTFFIAGVSLARGTMERVDSRSTGGPGCFLADATVRDSLCLSTVQPGLATGYSGPQVYTLKLRNVTVATTSTSDVPAMRADAAQGNQITVDAKNVVAFNASPTHQDIIATTSGATSKADLRFEASNYDVVSASGATVTAPGTGTNLTAAPLFADVAAGDLHPVAGSPTIDAGVEDALTGTSDIDGAQRVVGTAIDVGAYEFAPQPDPPGGDSDPTTGPDPSGDPDPTATEPPADRVPDDTIHPIADGPTPDTTITKAPALKDRGRKVTVAFTSDQADASFACSVDGGSYGSCSSPFSIRLTRGRHTIDVRATLGGRVDPTPARTTFTIARHARAR
jgi:hypothetical protein